MIDPLSVAGLAITIFDQIIKLGKETAQLISDVRAFDEDTDRLQKHIRDENSRNGLLRLLLFEASPIYGGRTLFEQFPDEIQEEISINLGEVETVIAEGVKLLGKRYSSSKSSPAATPYGQPTATNSFSTGTTAVEGGRTPSPSSLLTNKSPNPATNRSTHSLTELTAATHHYLTSAKSPFTQIRWSLRDKKRVEVIVSNFAALNSRIHEKVKLCSFASSIGLDVQHLRRLEQDPNAVGLGFNFDATLRLMAEQTQDNSEPLQIFEEVFADKPLDSTAVEERFATGTWHGKDVLFEKRNAEPQQPSNRLDERTAERMESLAKLLQQPKEQLFRIPRCIWWTYQAQRQQILLAFEIGSTLQQPPTSLRRLLGLDLKISLNDKFRLGFGLARCIAQFQMVRWVHESFRSENILFWSPNLAGTSPTELESRLDYGEPWVLGFEFSRPEVDFSSGFVDHCLERDLYRHPERQGRPKKTFNKIHDIYSLGIVLLEIGIWAPALTLAGTGIGDGRNPLKNREWFLKQARVRLESRMGRKYKEVVVRCLSGDFGVADDTREELRLQQAFRAQVVDVLEMTARNI